MTQERGRPSPPPLRSLLSEQEYGVLAVSLAAGTDESAVDRCSGDWTGAVRTAGGIRVALADLEGKGDGAAAYHARLDDRLRAQPSGPLTEWLDRLNADWPDDRFVSVALAEVDTLQHRLTVARAGHPAPLLRQPDGEVRSIAGLNFGLVGVNLAVPKDAPALPDYPFPPDSWLVLVSDGVEDAGVGRNDRFGRERLAAAVRNAHSPQGAARVVRRAVFHHLRGQALEDDFSVVVLFRHRVGAGALALDDPVAELWAELLLCGQAGDRDAFNLFARKATPWLVSRAARILRNKADANDVVQEALVRLLRYPYDPIHRVSPQTWLARLLRSAAADLMRRKRMPTLGDSDGEVESQNDRDDPARAIEVKEDWERLQQALLALDPAFREPIVLRYFDRISLKETAERLNLPVGTVGTRVYRGMGKLRQIAARQLRGKNSLRRA